MSIDIQALEANLLFKALTFAAYKHRYQFRKGTPPVPYINHPIAVAGFARERRERQGYRDHHGCSSSRHG